MNLSNLKPKTPKPASRRVGRGGKRGTYSGKGSKGQKSRAGAGVKPGFRGGDNRIWQLFPKQRGASKRPGNNKVHVKHRFYQLRHDKPAVVNVDELNKLSETTVVTPQILLDSGLVKDISAGVKILGSGTLKRKLDFEGIEISTSARTQIEKLGGSIKP